MSPVMTRPVEMVPLADLKEHPRNYRTHPEDQLVQLRQSLQEHGYYRNIVIAQDNTILAGHGVAQAARQVGLAEVRVVRLPLDPLSPEALRVLVGDNEIDHLAEQDDRALSELLKELAGSESDPVGLEGTGYDAGMLANLAMVTRPASEIKDFDEAAHWVGMPEYGESPPIVKLIVNCASPEDRDAFMAHVGIAAPSARTGDTWSIWWPEKEGREDLASLKFDVVNDE